MGFFDTTLRASVCHLLMMWAPMRSFWTHKSQPRKSCWSSMRAMTAPPWTLFGIFTQAP